MTGYILRRLVQLIPVLFLASIGIWAMVYAVPGSPIGAIVGEIAWAVGTVLYAATAAIDRVLAFCPWRWGYQHDSDGGYTHTRRKS